MKPLRFVIYIFLLSVGIGFYEEKQTITTKLIGVLQQTFLASKTPVRIQVNPVTQSSLAPDGQGSFSLYAPLQQS